MDQRGFSVDPSEAATPFVLPATRLQAWAALAERKHTLELVPAQRDNLAA